MIHITTHAIERYQERVANVSEQVARNALSCPAVQLAARFGAPYVRIGTGQRIVLDGNRVLTVLPADHYEGSMSMARTQSHAARRMEQG